jgi:hypothetical protein
VFTPFHKLPYPYLYGRSVDETTTPRPETFSFSSVAGLKDLVSCFSEHAVRISEVACSGSAAANAAAAAMTASRPATEAGGAGAAVMSGVTTVYRSRLAASGKDLLVDVTWSRTPDGPALSVAVHDASASSTSSCHPAALRHLHRRKASGTFVIF